MDTTQKLVVGLLIATIVLAVFSVVLNFSILGFDFPQRESNFQNRAPSSTGLEGNVVLSVEGSTVGGSSG
jgi:hypothetical protein